MITDTVSFITSITIIALYHLYRLLLVRNNPFCSIKTVNIKAREAWVDNIMSGGPGKDILAVQTLRNSTMSATFFASTAILLVLGVLNLLHTESKEPIAVFDTLRRRLTDGDIDTIKLLVLLVELLLTFFWFSLAVRMYNHVGFLINSSNSKYTFPPDFVAELLNRGGRYYSLGMRTYYLSWPVLFWLFGPIYLLAGTIGLIILLYHADRAPDVELLEIVLNDNE